MERLSQFFEGILLAVTTYPATLFNLLFSPRRVLGSEPDPWKCPPSLAVAIALFLYLLADSALTEIRYQGALAQGIPTLFRLSAYLVAIGIALAAIHFVIRHLFGLRATGDDPSEELKLLSYPFCIGLTAATLVIIIAVNFPNAALSLAPRLDSAFTAGTADMSSGSRFASAVSTVMAIPTVVLFAWSLFNVLRVGFSAKVSRSLIATIAALVTVGVLAVLVALAWEHTGNMIECLSSSGSAW